MIITTINRLNELLDELNLDQLPRLNIQVDKATDLKAIIDAVVAIWGPTIPSHFYPEILTALHERFKFHPALLRCEQIIREETSRDIKVFNEDLRRKNRILNDLHRTIDENLATTGGDHNTPSLRAELRTLRDSIERSHRARNRFLSLNMHHHIELLNKYIDATL